MKCDARPGRYQFCVRVQLERTAFPVKSVPALCRAADFGSLAGSAFRALMRNPRKVGRPVLFCAIVVQLVKRHFAGKSQRPGRHVTYVAGSTRLPYN